MIWMVVGILVAIELLWWAGWFVALALVRRGNYPADEVHISNDHWPAAARNFSIAWGLYHLPIVAILVPLSGSRGASGTLVTIVALVAYPLIAIAVWGVWTHVFLA